MGRRRNPDRRNQILEAALELFGTRGYHATQIADIAEALKIGHGTVYRYFTNKRDIFEQVFDQVVTRYVAAIGTEAPGAATTLEEYDAQLRRISAAIYGQFTESPASLRVALIAETVDEEMAARFRRTMDALAAVSAQRLSNGVARGFLRADLDCQATAELLLAATFEAVRRTLSCDDPKNQRRYLEASMRLFLDGMAA